MENKQLQELGENFRKHATDLTTLCNQFESYLNSLPGHIRVAVKFNGNVNTLSFDRGKTSWRLYIDDRPLSDCSTVLKLDASLVFPELLERLKQALIELNSSLHIRTRDLAEFLNTLPPPGA